MFKAPTVCIFILLLVQRQYMAVCQSKCCNTQSFYCRSNQARPRVIDYLLVCCWEWTGYSFLDTMAKQNILIELCFGFRKKIKHTFAPENAPNSFRTQFPIPFPVANILDEDIWIGFETCWSQMNQLGKSLWSDQRISLQVNMLSSLAITTAWILFRSASIQWLCAPKPLKHLWLHFIRCTESHFSTQIVHMILWEPAST